MQSLDYKLKTSNTSYATARHDVQYFPSSLSSFSPTTSRVCRIPLTSGTSFIDPESIKIAFRVRNTDGTNPLAPATPNPACFARSSRSSPTALRRHQLLRPHRGRARPAEGPRVQPQQGHGGFRRSERPAHRPRGAPGRLRGRAATPDHGGHPALREDAAAAPEPGDRN